MGNKSLSKTFLLYSNSRKLDLYTAYTSKNTDANKIGSVYTAYITCVLNKHALDRSRDAS